MQTYGPAARCWFVSIEPSPDGNACIETIRAANAGISTFIEQHEQWRYVGSGIWVAPTAARVRRCSDELHANAAAYAILARFLREELAGVTRRQR